MGLLYCARVMCSCGSFREINQDTESPKQSGGLEGKGGRGKMALFPLLPSAYV